MTSQIVCTSLVVAIFNYGLAICRAALRIASTHSLIWRPSRVADTPPLLPISRYGYCLFVADVCLGSEVLQPGSSWSSSGSGSMQASRSHNSLFAELLCEYRPGAIFSYSLKAIDPITAQHDQLNELTNYTIDKAFFRAWAEDRLGVACSCSVVFFAAEQIGVVGCVM